jgi:hypothetical protein
MAEPLHLALYINSLTFKRKATPPTARVPKIMINKLRRMTPPSIELRRFRRSATRMLGWGVFRQGR